MGAEVAAGVGAFVGAGVAGALVAVVAGLVVEVEEVEAPLVDDVVEVCLLPDVELLVVEVEALAEVLWEVPWLEVPLVEALVVEVVEV